jgi:RNA polymerase sigma-70 factor (ECF subfamily)
MKIAFAEESRKIAENLRPVFDRAVPWKRDLVSIVKSHESDSELHYSEDVAAALLLAARSGSNSSLGQLLQGYRDYLNLLADEELGSAIKVKASASDLVQDSFLEAKRDFRQFTGQSTEEFQAWLRRLMLNNVANVIRSFQGTEKRDISKETPASRCDLYGTRPLAGESKTASSIVMQNELLDVLQLAIQKLPGHYQDVIQWRNYDRASFEDIGTRLERSAEAARKLWVRAVELLQQELDPSHEAQTIRSGIAVQ